MPPPTLKDLERRFGLPPLTEITTLLSSDNGRKINSILNKLQKLADDKESLREATKLLELVYEMGRTGDLERLDSILSNLPKGKSGQAMLTQVRKLISELSEKLDKLSNLATTLMERED